MYQSVAGKAGGSCGSVRRYRLLRVAALLLLLAQQAAAGMVCLCGQACLTQTTDSRPARPSGPAAHSCHSESEVSGGVAEEGATSVGRPAGRAAQIAGSCCLMQAQPVYEAAFTADPVTIPAITPSPSALEAAAFRLVLSPAWGNCPRRSRPLYITQSCYLI
jgi:hypothetical protein